VARAAGAVLFNVLLLSALAGMDAMLLNLIFGAGDQLSLLAQMLLASLITVVFFMIGRPIRRMWQMVELSVAAAGAGIPSSPGLLSRLRKRRPNRHRGTVLGQRPRRRRCATGRRGPRRGSGPRPATRGPAGPSTLRRNGWTAATTPADRSGN